MIVRKDIIVYIALVFLLAIFAGCRLIGWANDTSIYYFMLNHQSKLVLANKEIFFRILIYLNTVFFSKNFYVFLLTFTFISISIKIFVFAKFSPLPLLSISLFMLSYFWLHDYIQIRAGVATGFFLLATKNIASGNTKKYFLNIFFAIMFHWSSILLIPLFFVIKYIDFKVYSFLPFIGICLKLAGINIFVVIQLVMELLSIDSTYYKMYAGYQNDINVFNLISISYIILFYIITFIFIKYKKSLSDIEIALYKFFAIGIFVFFITSLLNAPVVAFRLLEYFMTVLLLLIPYVVIKFRQVFFVSSLAVLYYGFYCYYLFNAVIVFK